MVTIIDKYENLNEYPMMSKEDLSKIIINKISELLKEN